MKVSKKYFTIVALHSIIAMGIILLLELRLNSLCGGILYLISLLPLIACMLSENRLFTPLTAAVLFDFSFGLYITHFVNNEKMMRMIDMLAIVVCILLWELISICSLNSAWVRNRFAEIRVEESSFKLMIACLFFAAACAMLFEWKMAGGIPILRADQETFRFTVKYSSLTHILAISNKIVVAVIGCYLINKRRVSIKKDGYLILMMIISELLMIATSMRGEMLFGPAVVFIVFGIRRKIPKKYFILAAIIGVVIVGFVPYIRMSNLYGAAYLRDLKLISTFKSLATLTPLVQTFSCNFSILAQDFLIFPNIEPFGHGDYSILPAIPFVTLGKSLMDLQNQIFNQGFYGGLTATFLATWYADFGYIGMVFQTILMAFWINYVYKMYSKNRNFFTLMWYAYTFYSSLWLVYSNTFDIVYLIYCLVIWIMSKMKLTQG